MPIDIDPLLMQQLLETFRIQLEERLQTISEGLLQLEKGLEAEQQEQILDEMFRAAHNIKGASRGIGLEKIADLSHSLESLFATLKRGETSLQSGLVSLCLTGLDMLRELLDIEGLGNQPGPEYTHLVEQLQMATDGAIIAPTPEKLSTPASKPTTNSKLQAPTSGVTASADSIRLPVQRLDKIAALASELQVARLRLEEHQQSGHKIADLSRRLRRYWAQMMEQSTFSRSKDMGTNRRAFAEGADLVLELEELCQAMDTSISATHALFKPLAASLRDDVHELRLISADTILKPLERIVRDIAQSEQKQVEFILEGAQLEMDRAVLEKVRDPLIHLLRNAVDHGIESPVKRVQAGKSEIGQITLSLAREGNSVKLSIKDDGNGINLNAIRNKAKQLELASSEELEEMPEKELIDFIFRPGFSSRQQVSDVSGRGVGLDVVRSNLQMLNGRVSVLSSEHKGTTFLLTIPLTMASEHGLFVRCADQTFAIPAQYIKRIMDIAPADIINLESKQAVIVDGKPVTIQNLAKFLHLPELKEPTEEYYQAIIIHSSWRQMGLIVNHIIGEQEMVIKSLSPPLDNLENVSGGTMGNNGEVVLVLDAYSLLGQRSSAIPIPAAHNKPLDKGATEILVVDDSITTRTLEVSILERQGYNVQAVINAEEAYEKLQTERFDLLISDVEMPGMNGFELTHQVRTKLGLTELPVIIVTSLASEADRRRGLEVKADAYIVKSEFESTELLNTVAQLI